mmetsp:Transcript_16916/g.40227  ORF Transcript_16916/g.40227 Transcript_16916/m.40227 type:complete len:207 (+) Transcript_16916:959-1579(+)
MPKWPPIWACCGWGGVTGRVRMRPCGMRCVCSRASLARTTTWAMCCLRCSVPMRHCWPSRRRCRSSQRWCWRMATVGVRCWRWGSPRRRPERCCWPSTHAQAMSLCGCMPPPRCGPQAARPTPFCNCARPWRWPLPTSTRVLCWASCCRRRAMRPARLRPGRRCLCTIRSMPRRPATSARWRRSAARRCCAACWPRAPPAKAGPRC